MVVGTSTTGSSWVPSRSAPLAPSTHRSDGLEIGYWVHAAHTRRGHASAAAAALTTVAFTLPGIEIVEIHHDRANLASEGVPRKLGSAWWAIARAQPPRQPSPAPSGSGG